MPFNIKEVLKRAVTWVKKATFPQLMRFLTQKKMDTDELLARAADFNRIMSTSAVYEVDVSGGDTKVPTGSKAKDKTNYAIIKHVDTGSDTIHLADFKAPERSKVSKYAQIVDELEATIEVFKAAELQLKSFNDVMAKKEMGSIRTYLKHLVATKDATLKTVEEITQKHMPPILTEITAELVRSLNKALPADSYGEMAYGDTMITSHETFAGKKNAAVEFTYYLYIEDLDQEQFNIDKFILPVTGVVYETAVYKQKSSSPSFNAPAPVSKSKPYISTIVSPAIQKLVNARAKIESEPMEDRPTKAQIELREKRIDQIQEKIVAARYKENPLVGLRMEAAELEAKKPTEKIKKRLAEIRDEIPLLKAAESKKATADEVRRSKAEAKRLAMRTPESSYFSMGIYVTSLNNKFAPPGFFDVGAEIKGSTVQAIKRNLLVEVLRLISMHSVSPAFNRIRIDVATQALRHSALTNVNGVDDAENDNGDVLLHLAVKDPRIIKNDIWPDVIVAMKTVMNSRRASANFIYSLESKRSKTIMRVSYVKG